MKNVLLFIDSLGSGGAQRQLVGLAQLLNNRNYNVKVVTYYNRSFFKDGLLRNKIEHENLAPTKIKIRRILLFRNVICTYRPEIIISYLDTPNIISIVASLYKKSWKLVVSERSTTQSLDFRAKVRFFLYRYVDQVIVNSHSQFNFLNLNFPHLKNKIVLISNSLDLSTFKFAPLNLDFKGILEIGVVGRFERQKNVVGMARAIKILLSKGYNIRVTWHGRKNLHYGSNSEGDNYFLEISEEIKNLGIENEFLLCDPIKDVISFYHSIDALCLPSFNEGFPNVIAEAIACGKPILASNFGDINLMVKEGLNGFLFDPHSIESIVSAFEKYCALNVDEISRMGRESRIIATNLLSEETFIEKYINVIDGI